MSSNRAEDNVTTNEQMIEVLSVAWKELPKMMRNDWAPMKKQVLSELAQMEGMDNPADDHMVHMLVKIFGDYPDVVWMLNEISYQVTGKRRPEFEAVLDLSLIHI